MLESTCNNNVLVLVDASNAVVYEKRLKNELAAGHRWFSGARKSQGPGELRDAEPPNGLILMGVWRVQDTTPHHENKGAYRTTEPCTGTDDNEVGS